MGEQERMVEAVLFASVDPVTVRDLESRMPHGCDAAEALAHLRKRYEGRGVQVVKIEDAWAIRTSADLGFLMQKESVETRKLSRAAIETLAIIAYQQPVTRADIEQHGPWRFDRRQYLILNFALGGNYPNAVNKINAPYYGMPQETADRVAAGEITMEVDWVRVWGTR